MPVSFVGAAAGAASLASSISGLTSGGNQPQISGGAPQIYQLTGQGSQDQMLQNTLTGMQQTGQNYAAGLPPAYQQYANNILYNSNPYAQQQLGGAGDAASLAPRIANQQLGGAGQLYGGAGQLMGEISPLLQAGFDPQNALYNRTVGRLTDQQAAANAASGVAGPYAAGLTGDRLSNFNIDWQNNQLQRELAASQGALGLLRGAGAGFAGASDLGNLAQKTELSQGLPYQTYLQQQQNNFDALNQLQAGTYNAYQLPQQYTTDALAYLGRGQAGAQNALAAQNQGFQQQGQLGQNIAGAVAPGSPLMSGLQSGLNSLFGPSQYNPPAGTDTSSQTPYNFYTGSFADGGGY